MPRISAAFHIFTSVLLIGTMWRVVSYHAMASPNTSVQHVGAAMSVQY